MPGVNGFKVIQETLLHCRLQLVTDARFRASRRASRRSGAAFRARLGEGVQLDIEHVEAIAA
jgi:hypothetical protein